LCSGCRATTRKKTQRRALRDLEDYEAEQNKKGGDLPAVISLEDDLIAGEETWTCIDCGTSNLMDGRLYPQCKDCGTYFPIFGGGYG